MLLTKYGIREWLIITCLCAAAGACALWFSLSWLAAIIAVIWLALMSFFRDPVRSLPANLGQGDMISPADGTVSAVLTVDRHEATDGPAVIIRIFLSVLNVHVNRAPFDGHVVAIAYRKGKFLNAQTDESADVNESNLIMMRTETDEVIGVRQVAGMIARRIVCPLSVGDQLVRGARFGMIKFGSTTELILPRPNDVTVHVKEGDSVRGGRTILASLTFPSENSAVSKPIEKQAAGTNE